MRPRTLSLLTLLAVLVLAAPRVGAQPAGEREAARADLQAGVALYDRGDYAGALRRFDAAYGRFPSPKIQFNRGQCLKALGRRAEAIDAFQKFLGEAPDAAPQLRSDARRLVEGLKAEAAGLDVAPVGVTGSPAGAPRLDLAGAPSADPSGAPPASLAAAPPASLAAAPPASLAAAPPASLAAAPSAGAAAGTAASNRWWVWVGVGILVVGIGAIALAASRNPTTAALCPGCDLPTAKVPTR